MRRDAKGKTSGGPTPLTYAVQQNKRTGKQCKSRTKGLLPRPTTELLEPEILRHERVLGG